MDAVAGFFSALPEEMRDPVLFAIPCFLLLLILEWTAARKLESIETAATGQPRPASGAYLTRDSVASISMGLVSIATTAGWKSLALLGYAAIYAYLAPWQLSAHRWYTWVIAIVGVDLLYYSYHRIAHRVRLIWATHQAHHSSEYFNFATALRQKWNNSGEILMWVPLPLMGLPPWMVFCSWSLNLIYQFWVHTERIDRLPRWFEFVFNTPSHHRVHHGMDPVYLDKNYEPPRHVRRLQFLERMGSCQVVHRGGTRRSCVSGRCGWSQRSAVSTIRSGQRSVRSPVYLVLAARRRCVSGCARRRSMPAHGPGPRPKNPLS
ncbi:C-5 sterol desaturase Erg3 [Mycobacterium tuberculosis KT-0089]|nr:C-5 sterol desaturase Erg3 [Mycobacterium tuberculosis KT-0089]